MTKDSEERAYTQKAKHDDKVTSTLGPDSTRRSDRPAPAPETTLRERHASLLDQAKNYNLGNVSARDVAVGLAVVKLMNDCFRRNSLLGVTEEDEYGLIRALSGEEPIFSPEHPVEEAHGVETGARHSTTKAKPNEE